MQIVIDISEDDYRKIQDGRASVSMMRKTIRNGIPLDKIRAEIEINKKGFPPSSDYYKAINRALVIIDKYKAESEE